MAMREWQSLWIFNFICILSNIMLPGTLRLFREYRPFTEIIFFAFLVESCIFSWLYNLDQIYQKYIEVGKQLQAQMCWEICMFLCKGHLMPGWTITCIPSSFVVYYLKSFSPQKLCALTNW